MEAAIDVAASAARRYLLSRAAFRASVIGTSRQLQKYRRAAFTIRQRQVVLCTEPKEDGAHDLLEPLPRPNRYDAWAVERGPLERATLVASACPDCGPQEAHACTTCGGHRIVHAWLTLEERTVTRVVVSSMYIAAHVHADVARLEDFDTSPERLPARLEEDTGWTTPSETIPTELEPELEPAHERIEELRVQTFVVPIHSVTYRLVQGRGTIETAGMPPRLLPWSSFNPLRLRLVVYALCAGVALFAGATAGLGFDVGRYRAVLATVGLFAAQLGLLRWNGVWARFKRTFPRRLGGIRIRLDQPLQGVTRTAPTH